MSAPPPLPPGASRSDQMTDAFAQRRAAAPPSSGPPKQGMSGCAIAAIIGAVVLVLGVFVIAMLAAIALPAYQQYIAKSRVMEALTMARAHQVDVDAYREKSGVCPDNAAIGLADDEVFTLSGDNAAAPGQASLRIGEIESGHCGIELQFKNINVAVDDKTLLLESTDNGWTCTGGTLGAQYRTPQCRNFDPTP